MLLETVHLRKEEKKGRIFFDASEDIVALAVARNA